MTNDSGFAETCRHNVELKARRASLDDARQTARRLADDRVEPEHQTDSYFRCQRGRLKLREIQGGRAELIWYDRADQTEPKACRYALVPVEDATAVKRALAAALGVRHVVVKDREIFLRHNVRIHLDRVEGLGEFIEFEAVLEPEQSPEEGQAQVDELRREFGIAPEDLITGSYVDLANGHAK